jgi:hypothetical protein
MKRQLDQKDGSLAASRLLPLVSLITKLLD